MFGKPNDGIKSFTLFPSPREKPMKFSPLDARKKRGCFRRDTAIRRDFRRNPSIPRIATRHYVGRLSTNSLVPRARLCREICPGKKKRRREKRRRKDTREARVEKFSTKSTCRSMTYRVSRHVDDRSAELWIASSGDDVRKYRCSATSRRSRKYVRRRLIYRVLSRRVRVVAGAPTSFDKSRAY